MKSSLTSHFKKQASFRHPLSQEATSNADEDHSEAHPSIWNQVCWADSPPITRKKMWEQHSHRRELELACTSDSCPRVSSCNLAMVGVYWHHRNWKMLQIRISPPPREPALNIPALHRAVTSTATSLRLVPENHLGKPPTSWGCKFN